MRKQFLLLVIIASLGMIGCAGRFVQPVDPAQMNEAVKSTEAVIVFVRSSKFVGGAISLPIIEASKDEKLNFVTILPGGTKYLYRTTPGRHLYFAINGNDWWAFPYRPDAMLEANLEAGKTYYAYLTPALLGFVFEAVPDTTKESLKKDLASCRWVQNAPKGQNWFKNNLPRLEKKYAPALTKDQTAAPDGKNVIKPAYGTNTPVR